MKLAEDVLLEIVSIIQRAILEGTDASQELRALDLSVDNDKVCLTRNLKTN